MTKVLTLVLMGACIMMLSLGCPTTSSGTRQLTLKETSDQVEDAMLTYRNASIAGALTAAQTEGIKAAYKNYKTAYDAALAQAGSGKNAASPDNVKAAAEQVIARVSAIP